MKRLSALTALTFMMVISVQSTVLSPTIQNLTDRANNTNENQSSERNSSGNTVFASESSPTEVQVVSNIENVPSVVTEKKAVGYSERREGSSIVTENGERMPLIMYKPMFTPNDPQATQSWTNAVNMPGAWAVGAGNTETILAVIDTGFALNHEEFSNRWFTNPLEMGPTSQEAPSKLNCTDRGLPLDRSCNLIDDNGDGIVDNEVGPTSRENKSQLNCTDQGLQLDKSCNLIDDSGNGLIDDWRGFDFMNFDRSAEAGETNEFGSGTTHGSLVSGVAAATGNNGIGVAGVDWFTKILPLQALDDDSFGDSLSVGRAIRYAADMNADVISISLGASSPDTFLRSAVRYAVSRGSIVVAASGNDGCRCISFPANYEEVLAVGATDQSDVPASFSNWGPNLDIIAPGVGLRTTTWTRTNRTTAYAASVSGTSFATPLVAGLLTLARSHQPNASAQQLIATVTEQANRLNMSATTVRSETLGYGRAQANAVLNRVSTVQTPILRTGFRTVSGGSTLGAFEPDSAFTAYMCDGGRLGTTSIFRLFKTGSTVYTTSAVERQQAISQGYSESLLGVACLSLPTDRPTSLRLLNVTSEFENRHIKE